MATLNNIYNLVECGSSSVLGTGTKGCNQFLKKASSIWFHPKGFKYDGTKTLDEEYVQEMQADGNLIILKGLNTFTDNSSEDIIETLDDGTKQVATLGLYEFAVQFVKGLGFHAALHSLNSYDSYDVVFVDRDGNVFGTKASDGSFKGFTVGMVQGNKLGWASDSTGQKTGLMFQLTNRAELDVNYIYIQQKQLGTYYPQSQDGINEVVLEFDSVPADSGTTITITAKNKSNNQPWTGGLTDDFMLTNNGTELTQTVTETSGTYVFTVSALSATNVITASINGVINKDGDLYKSTTITAITV